MATLKHADSLLGAVVRKRAGAHWYAGRVVGMTPSNSGEDRSCRVTYEDGEEADVPESEVRVWVAAMADVPHLDTRALDCVSDSGGRFTFPSGPTPPCTSMPRVATSRGWFASVQGLARFAFAAGAFCIVVIFTGTFASVWMFRHRFWDTSGPDLSIQDEYVRAADGGSFSYDVEGANIDRVDLLSELPIREWRADYGITRGMPEISQADAFEPYVASVSHAEYLDMFSSSAQKLDDRMAGALPRAGHSIVEGASARESPLATVQSWLASPASDRGAVVVESEVLQKSNALIFQPQPRGPSSTRSAFFAGSVDDEIDLPGGLTLVCASLFTTIFLSLRGARRAAIDEKRVYFAEDRDEEFAASAVDVHPGCPMPVTEVRTCGTLAPDKSAGSSVTSLPPGHHLPDAGVGGSPSGRPRAFPPAVVAAGCCMFPEPCCGSLSAAAPQVVVGAHYVAMITSAADAEPGGVPSVVRVIGGGQQGPGSKVVVLPCRQSQKKTFRQSNVREAMELPVADIHLGPFLLFGGRAPAFVLEHMQRAQPRPALSSQVHAPGHKVCSSTGQAQTDADWEAVAKRSSLVVSGARFKHCSQLRQLKAMGFQDERALRDMLVKHDGDVLLVIEKMCNRASTEKTHSLFDIMVHRRRVSIGGA